MRVFANVDGKKRVWEITIVVCDVIWWSRIRALLKYGI
jgi:hypothetical protein